MQVLYRIAISVLYAVQQLERRSKPGMFNETMSTSSETSSKPRRAAVENALALNKLAERLGMRLAFQYVPQNLRPFASGTLVHLSRSADAGYGLSAPFRQAAPHLGRLPRGYQSFRGGLYGTSLFRIAMGMTSETQAARRGINVHVSRPSPAGLAM